MLETLTHAIVSVTVIAAATVLAALNAIDATAWAAAVAAGIGISGSVSVLQGRASNGKLIEEARELIQIPGGRRFTDPPVPSGHEPPAAQHTGYPGMEHLQ